MGRSQRGLAALGLLALSCGGAADGGPQKGAELAFKLLPAEAAEACWHGRGAVDPLAARLSAYELIRGEVERTLEDARRSVLLPVPGEWAVAVDVPAAATLSFGTRLDAPGVGALYLPVLWSVSFADEAGERVLWRSADVAAPPDGGGWRERAVALDDLALKRGRLVFRAAPGEGFAGGASALHAVLAAPAIGTQRDARPNVLVITVDTLRRDLLAPYGGDPALTPSLARLAARGVVVEQSWSTSSWTLPSYASLLTGEYPSTHGAGRDFELEWKSGAIPSRGVAEGVASLVLVCDRAGYTTQAFYNNANLRRGSGLERGFDGYVHYGVTGRAAVTAFRQWLATRGDRPFFCFLHLADPHSPYIPPASYVAPPGTPDPRDVPALARDAHELQENGVPAEERADLRALYRAEVGATDALIGEVLDELERSGAAEKTLVVFHVDHGEELWDHGGWFHGKGHHVELVHTPLVFSMPGTLSSGARVAGPFRGVDVLPTALDLVGLWPGAGAPEVEGISLARLLRGEDGPLPPPALSEGPLFGAPGDFALTHWPWRMHVAGGRTLLFDVAADPTETVDLAAREPERVAELTRVAAELRARAERRRRGVSLPIEVDAATEEALGRLGYVGGDDD